MKSVTQTSNFVEVQWRVRGCTPEPLQAEMTAEPHPDADVFYLFGGAAAPTLYPWLEENGLRHLVVLERAEQPLADLLATELHPRMSLHFIVEPLFDELYATFAGAQAQVEASASYATLYPEELQTLRERILGGASRASTIVSEFLGASEEFYTNFFRNLTLLPQAYNGAGLFGQFKGVPAIICGAGPSLDATEIPLDRGLVFAPGSALNALSNRGIVPHFGAGIDPYPAQFQRMMTNSAFEVPIFYRNRWHHETLALWHGPRLFLRGVGGYPIASWFEEQMGITGETLDEGHNVVNLCLDLARALGCSPIILVGMDLAFTDGLVYADGIVPNRTYDPEQPTHFYGASLVRPNIDGKPVRTLWKWLSEAEWIGRFAQDTPVINATGGGMGMPGVPNEPMPDLPRIPDLHERVHAAIQGAPLEVGEPPLLEMRQSLKRSLQMVQSLQKKRAGSGEAALLEVELEEEAAWQALAPADFVYRAAYRRGDLSGRLPFLEQTAQAILEL